MTLDRPAPVFPPKLASVTAEVLVRLLNGERLTSLDAVAGASTTRLAAVVHYLTTAYGWPISSRDKAAACRDGRTAHVAEYFMPSSTIESAMATGGASWCASVRAARAAQRVGGSEAKTAGRQVAAA